MNIDPADIVKIVTGCLSTGAGFAFAKPFAARLFTLWLDRIERRQKFESDKAAAELEKERALKEIAVLHERTIGILENVDKRLKCIEERQDRQDSRWDRLEMYMGVPQTASALPPNPSPVPPAPAPRRQLTNPDIKAGPLPDLAREPLPSQ